MTELACAVCKTTESVLFRKAGNFRLPLCSSEVACAERYKQRRASGSHPSGGSR